MTKQIWFVDDVWISLEITTQDKCWIIFNGREVYQRLPISKTTLLNLFKDFKKINKELENRDFDDYINDIVEVEV